MPDHRIKSSENADKTDLGSKRLHMLKRLEQALDLPMLVLGIVWLILLIWELTEGLNPALELLGLVIWVLFILNFLIEFFIAPHKPDYLKQNWLTAISLLVPALRVFRMLRFLRAVRGIRLVKVIGSLNRSMHSLGASFKRRGFGYVMALTIAVTLAGAAGMHAFEKNASDGFTSYGEALWWTAMIMTTMGSQAWPQTPEGRILCLLLSLYAFAVFGFVTAALASYFVGRENEDKDPNSANTQAMLEVKNEITALRQQLRAMRTDNPDKSGL